jgi:hypothetical protein
MVAGWFEILFEKELVPTADVAHVNVTGYLPRSMAD